MLGCIHQGAVQAPGILLRLGQRANLGVFLSECIRGVPKQGRNGPLHGNSIYIYIESLSSMNTLILSSQASKFEHVIWLDVCFIMFLHHWATCILVVAGAVSANQPFQLKEPSKSERRERGTKNHQENILKCLESKVVTDSPQHPKDPPRFAHPCPDEVQFDSSLCASS